MQKLLLLLVILISISASAQTNKLVIGITASPDICYRTLKNNGGGEIAELIINYRNDYEHPKLGYTAGMSVCYNLSERIGIETGLQYATKGETSINSDFKSGDHLDSNYGFVSAKDPTTELKSIYNYNYLDIPVRAIFSFGQRKIRFISSIGLTTNVFLYATKKNIYTFESGEKKTEKVDQPYTFKPVGLTSTISAGIDCQLNNKMNLRVEPTFRYGLSKIIDTPVTARLWSAGLNITCYYAIQ